MVVSVSRVDGGLLAREPRGHELGRVAGGPHLAHERELVGGEAEVEQHVRVVWPCLGKGGGGVQPLVELAQGLLHLAEHLVVHGARVHTQCGNLAQRDIFPDGLVMPRVRTRTKSVARPEGERRCIPDRRAEYDRREFPPAPKAEGAARAAGPPTRPSIDLSRNGHGVLNIRPRVKTSILRATSVTVALCLGTTAAPAETQRPGLQSALSTAPTPITLSEAVSRALERNPSYATAREEIRRTEALLREVEATWLPTLSGNGVYAHLDSARIVGGVVEVPANGLNANLLLTVPLVMPRQWANHAEATENTKVQRASSEEVRRQVALATGRAYLAVYAQKLVVEVDERARDTARKHYDYAHQRYRGGVGTSLDEVRAAQEVAGDEALVQQAYSSLASAEEALGVLVGADGPLDTAEEPALAEPPTLAAGLEDAEHRTDVIAYDLKRRAAERVTRHDYTDFLPFLVGTAQPFYQTPALPTVPETGYQMELILTLPLYDGGVRYGQAKERDALATEARIAFEGQVRQARSDVRASFEALLRADEALKASRDGARLANRALELANLAYTAGATSDIEVIDAERVARDAETQAEIAADTARQARLNLLSATNRFP